MMKEFILKTKNGDIIPGRKLLKNDGTFIDIHSGEEFVLSNGYEVLPQLDALLIKLEDKYKHVPNMKKYIGSFITVRPGAGKGETVYFCYELQEFFWPEELEILNVSENVVEDEDEK